MKKSISFLTAALLSLILVGCSSDDSAEIQQVSYPETPELSRTESAHLDAIKTFGNKFLAASQANWDKTDVTNQLASPLGAAIFTSMLANGCEGNALDQITAAFGVQADDIPAINSLMNKICVGYPHNVPGSTLAIANSLWTDNSVSIADQFAELLGSYQASIANVDMQASPTLDAVNRWGSDNTFGMIPRWLDNIPSGTKAILANALYYSADWLDKFKPEDTYKATFHNLGSTTSTIDMMKGTQEITYLNDGEGELFSLHYDNRNAQITIYLPATDSATESMPDFSRLDNAVLYTDPIVGDCDIRLPKFDIEIDNSITDILKDIGITDAFDSGKNSLKGSLISAEPCSLSECKQVLRVLVDENGTKLAAITGGVIDGAVLPDDRLPERITVDRPFIFKVEYAGLPLLYGRVAKL